MKWKKKKKRGEGDWLPKLTKKKAIQTGKGMLLDAGSGVVGALGATGLGKWGFALGGILLLAGNYVNKDFRQYFSIAGVSALVQAVAKGSENESIEEEASINGVGFVALKEGAKNRLISFKNDWLRALRIDKFIKPNQGQESSSSIGSINLDLSELDAIEDSVKASAVNYQMQLMEEEEDYEDYENEPDYENQTEYEDDQTELIEFSEDEDVFEQIDGIYTEEEFDLSTI